MSPSYVAAACIDAGLSAGAKSDFTRLDDGNGLHVGKLMPKICREVGLFVGTLEAAEV